MTVWLTVPTAGRHDYLPTIVASSGLPADRVVLVNTSDTPAEIPGAHHLTDRGEVNIHRWWNLGIDYAQERGATRVLVVNDDVSFGPDLIPALSEALDLPWAVIASPVVPGNPRPVEGSCFLLDLSSGVRPDESFRWWYGDDDLGRQAAGRTVRVPVPFQHLHPNESTAESYELQALTVLDQRAFTAKWEGVAANG